MDEATACPNKVWTTDGQHRLKTDFHITEGMEPVSHPPSLPGLPVGHSMAHGRTQPGRLSPAAAVTERNVRAWNAALSSSSSRSRHLSQRAGTVESKAHASIRLKPEGTSKCLPKQLLARPSTRVVRDAGDQLKLLPLMCGCRPPFLIARLNPLGFHSRPIF
jgi:hypothetical protein